MLLSSFITFATIIADGRLSLLLAILVVNKVRTVFILDFLIASVSQHWPNT